MTVKGCSSECLATKENNKFDISNQGVPFKANVFCCEHDNCNSSTLVLSNLFAIVSLLIASNVMKKFFA